jgi:pimeloyl-ACP methyl ester carboxylesterase
MALIRTQIEKLARQDAVDLHFSAIQSTKKPLIILHGLFGSGRNWTSIATKLQNEYSSILVDQRNHGQSPHSQEHGLAELVADLERLRKKLNLDNLSLLGHSMGGLVAMAYALLFPERLADLIIVDIAPRQYGFKHAAELQALQMDMSFCPSRSAADEALAPVVPDPLIRQFLLTNLEKTESGYHWRINAAALEKSRLIEEFSWDGLPYGRPVLAIRGEQSEYFLPEDSAIMQQFFPAAQIESIQGGGHWIHYSHGAEFIKIIQLFAGRFMPHNKEGEGDLD